MELVDDRRRHKTRLPFSMIVIGVDPAFRKGGFWACIIDTTESVAAFRSFRDVLEFDRFLQSADAPDKAIVCIENSNKQNMTFSRNATGHKDELMRKSRNVGANQAVSELAVRAAVDRYGQGSILNVSPSEKGRKWSASEFKALAAQHRIVLWNYTGSQDQRDAYKLADMALREAKKPSILKDKRFIYAQR